LTAGTGPGREQRGLSREARETCGPKGEAERGGYGGVGEEAVAKVTNLLCAQQQSPNFVKT
jgi:hypothetical protein